MVVKRKKSLFGKPPKSKRLADIISITSPTAFRRSIRTLKNDADGFTKEDRRASIFTKNRARAQLKRKNISPKERKQFTEIINKVRIPKAKKKR